jgi:DNA-binding HxlR family transcriptional regulator
MTKKFMENNCPMRATLRIIGGKWKPLVLQQLNGQVRRFSDFKRLIPEITKQMLTKSLRELEKDKIINRKIYPVVPPKVEYSLTKKGESLIPVLEMMAVWGQEQLFEK